MKSLIVSALMLLFPLVSSAANLTKATTLELKSADGLTDVKNLKVTLSVYCTYKFGLLFPESRPCGNKTQTLTVDAGGVVQIPAIEKFAGLQAKKADHYKVDLTIYDGEEYLAILSAWGERKISNFNFDGKRLDLYRLNKATINVSYEGSDFFGSELSKVERASLGLSVSEIGEVTQYEQVSPTSTFRSHIWSRENFLSYAGKPQLKDVKEITVEKLNFAKFNSRGDEKFEVLLYYHNTVDHQAAKLKGKVIVKLGQDALESIGTIELKK